MKCIVCKARFYGRRRNALYCSDRCGRNCRTKRYKRAHPERVKSAQVLQNAKTEQRILSRVRYRAKEAGLPFDLELSDIVVPTHCPILGIPLIRHQGVIGFHPNSPSLDRIVPSLGYVKGNVRVISGRANMLKSNATHDELKRVLVDVLSRPSL